MQVGENGLADLDAAHVRFGPVIENLSLAERLAVHEAHIACLAGFQPVGHDAVRRYTPAITVRFKLTGGSVDVITFVEQSGRGHDLSGGGQLLVFDAGLWRLVLADDDVLQI